MIMKKEIIFSYPNYTPIHPVSLLVEKSVRHMNKKNIPEGTDIYRPVAVCGPYLYYGYGFGYDMSKEEWFGDSNWYKKNPDMVI